MKISDLPYTPTPHAVQFIRVFVSVPAGLADCVFSVGAAQSTSGVRWLATEYIQSSGGQVAEIFVLVNAGRTPKLKPETKSIRL